MTTNNQLSDQIKNLATEVPEYLPREGNKPLQSNPEYLNRLRIIALAWVLDHSDIPRKDHFKSLTQQQALSVWYAFYVLDPQAETTEYLISRAALNVYAEHSARIRIEMGFGHK